MSANKNVNYSVEQTASMVSEYAAGVSVQDIVTAKGK